MSAPQTDFHRDTWRLPAPTTERKGDPEVEYYLSHITSVKSVDDLLSDDRLYRFAITAFGLAEMSDARAFMQRILTEGTSGARGFALELADQRLRSFVETFDFTAHGVQTTQRDAARHQVVERYARIMLENEAGRYDEGARLMLSFQRKIRSVRSIYGILGDSDLFTVVRIALRLPAVQSGPEIEHQSAVIAAQINLKDFEDSELLAAFLRRFSSEWQRWRGSRASAERAGQNERSSMPGVSGDVLMSVQAMKTGSL